MGNFWSTAKNRTDEWDFTEEELQARYFHDDNSTPQPAIPEFAATKRKAEAHCAYMIPTLLGMAREKPELNILDVGCGSGEITVDFAEMCPRARVVGMDVSGAMLGSARVYAERRRVGNVEFVEGSVYDMPEEWTGSFDVVCTHQVVAHLGDKISGIRELVRVAARKTGDGSSGGVLCMREGDLRSARFGPGLYKELEECFEVIVAVHEANGGASDAGRRLKEWTVEAGVRTEDVVATRSVWRYDTPEGRREYGGHWPGRCTQGVFAEWAMALGVSEERMQEYAVAWKRWIEDENGSFAMLHGEIVARVNWSVPSG